ncbi:MAG: SDR family oxidoreductase [Myxococcales bacterium]|nr:SDR family oxidoreductase [Myxococcales bacterium]
MRHAPRRRRLRRAHQPHPRQPTPPPAPVTDAGSRAPRPPRRPRAGPPPSTPSSPPSPTLPATLDVLVNAAAVIRPAPQAIEPRRLQARHGRQRPRRLPLLPARLPPHARPRQLINLKLPLAARPQRKFPGLSTYTASKAAVIGLTEALAVEGRPHRIRVNAIAPGAVDTVMLRTAAPFLRTSTTPDDIAPTAVFLADPIRSGKISGAVLEVFSNE